MQDDRSEQESDPKFDAWLRRNAGSYNSPPEPQVEQMWSAIEASHFDAAAPGITPVIKLSDKRASWRSNNWLRVAAALVVGVGLGRVTAVTPSITGTPTAPVVASAPTVDSASTLNAIDDPTASRYLGQTVALLASLQSDSRESPTDTLFRKHATDLLLTTRLLLDSQSAKDPKVRALLDDLELVLAQIVQMPNKRNASDLDLIHQAMEQRDVMPRLRTAVANTSSAD